jgi:uncharacterized membrane protein
MHINGLPAHFLLVHFVVVLLPLTAVAAIVASVWPAAQRKLTFLIPAGAVAGAVVVPIAVRAGNDFFRHLGSPAYILHHQQLGLMVFRWAAALALTTTTQWLALQRNPSQVVRIVLAVLVIASAIGTAVIVVLTGDAGSRAVWGNR